MRDDLRKIERMSEQLLSRIVETDNPTLVKVYEDKLGKLEKGKILMREAIGKCGRPLESFEDTYRTALSGFSQTRRNYGIPRGWSTKEPS